MKNILFSLVNKLGYRVVNKKSEREQLALPLKKFGIFENFDILFQSKYYIQNLEKKFSDLSIINHKGGFLVGFKDYRIYVESAGILYLKRDLL